ncbi:MAG: nitroreductase family protein [Flavobacteriaceae bacterium]
MSILKTICSRRSIFPAQYTSDPIPQEEIHALLEAANWAPTHRKTEPWRFYVIQGDQRQKLGKFLAEKYRETDAKFSEFKYKKILHKPQQAAAVIAIVMQRCPKQSVPEWEEVAATAMAVQNLWLLATEKGLGGYWSSPKLAEYMPEFLDMQSGEKCLGFFYLGNYDGNAPMREPTPIADKIVWLGESTD